MVNAIQRKSVKLWHHFAFYINVGVFIIFCIIFVLYQWRFEMGRSPILQICKWAILWELKWDEVPILILQRYKYFFIQFSTIEDIGVFQIIRHPLTIYSCIQYIILSSLPVIYRYLFHEIFVHNLLQFHPDYVLYLYYVYLDENKKYILVFVYQKQVF